MTSITGSATTTIEKLEALAKAGKLHEVGRSFFIFSKGWISVEDEGDSWAVIYTNGKDLHQPLGGPSYGADFEKRTGDRKIGPGYLTGAWESAIRMWPVLDDARAEYVFNHVKNLVHDAYDFRMAHASP